MGRSTAQLRRDYSPACTHKHNIFLPAYRALDIVFENHGYRPEAGHTGAHACRRITGGSGYSLHAYGPGDKYIFWTGVAVWTAVACDVNWRRNPYGKKLVTDMSRAMIDDVYKIKTVDGLQVWFWGGDYNSVKDAMHFELDVSPAQLARGVVMPGADAPAPAPGPGPGEQRYTVGPGDTLAEIASDHGTTWQALAERNRLPDPNRLEVGQVLIVPRTGTGRAPPTDDFKEDVMAKQVLRKGARNADVKLLQALLVAWGIGPGSWFGPEPYGTKPDGVFGAGLEAKLKDWQRYVGLPANGVCDSDDWRKLLLL